MGSRPLFYTHVLAVLFLWAGLSSALRAADSDGDTLQMERAKALAYPYANDLGPASIDVSSYPKPLQETYRTIVLVKCQRCHTAARPLNSEFVEPDGPKIQEAAKIAVWKKIHPDWFDGKNRWVWHIEGFENGRFGIWEQYIKKMMVKPGCDLSPADGKKIWDFLRYDSEHRKLGDHAQAWAAHRRALLEKFKNEHPDRYRELYETR